MLIYAHRGASAMYPENTLRAFRACPRRRRRRHRARRPRDGGRCPGRHSRSRCRAHDRWFRLCRRDRSGATRDLDAGNGERVPTLAEVLELVGGAAHLDVEIKGPGIEAWVLEVLAEYPAVRWAISSFAWDTLRTVRQLDPIAELWPLAEQVDDDLFAIAAELGSPAVSLFTGAYTAERAAKLRDAGLCVMVWTVNDSREARRVADLGAFALCTDDPQRISQRHGSIS